VTTNPEISKKATSKVLCHPLAGTGIHRAQLLMREFALEWRTLGQIVTTFL